MVSLMVMADYISKRATISRAHSEMARLMVNASLFTVTAAIMLGISKITSLRDMGCLVTLKATNTRDNG